MRKLTVKLQRSRDEALTVGTLAEQDRRSYFEYAPTFLDTGLQLSPFKLPLRPELIEHADLAFGPLPGLFDDSLPDGWGLLLMDRHFRGQGIDPATLVPEQEKCPGRPSGPTVVELPDGRKWEFHFVKVACNVAHPLGAEGNQLPELLREWFGSQAGVPGTNATVEFTPRGDIWSVRPVMPAAAAAATPVKAIVGRPSGMVAERPADQESWVPVYELAAAAGAFSEEQVPEPMGWLHPSGGPARTGDFVAQVRGHSMEPTIPDGAWCLFRPNVVGSRNGKILLVQHRSITDPEHGGRFTVKRYRSEKITAGDTWEHAAISLEPINTVYKSLVIDPQQARDLRVIAEFVEVLEPSTP